LTVGGLALACLTALTVAEAQQYFSQSVRNG
jgi:hypothetical protein